MNYTARQALSMDRVAYIITLTHSNIVVLCLCTASASTAMALISMLRATYLKQDRATGTVKYSAYGADR